MSLGTHLYGKLFVAFFVLVFLGCGYKPSSKHARTVVGERISTNVIISSQDPENTVVIRDAVDSAVIEIFRASLVEKNYADTHLVFMLQPPVYAPVQFDSNGFIVGYRATITLTIVRKTKGTEKRYSAHGTYDFSVNPNSVLTEQQRFDAIKFSAAKAITSFVAQVSAEGSRKTKE
jgi:hypothetical protein